jgi:hypothetical protein
MADGSRREISTLKSGEFVWNPVRQREMRIEWMMVGPEAKPMLEIESNGSSVRVTDGHPMLILASIEGASGSSGDALGGHGKAKAIKAQDVAVGDLMLGSDGGFHPVTAVRVLPVEAGQQVWNLKVVTDSEELEDHVIEADGIPTGDITVQQQLAGSKK